MATSYLEYRFSGFSIVHTAAFYINSIEYELTLQNVSQYNLGDSSISFPSGYIFSPNGCWEFSFDLAENLNKGTSFARAPKGEVNPFAVLRKVESMIFDHYNQFGAGMYSYMPADKQLVKFYDRLVKRRLGNGFTLESGFNSDGSGYVIRTPKCYK